MTNLAHGLLAEDRVEEYLKGLGYQVLDRNWRTRYCEIDIIAKKDKVVYFVEVKYRQSLSQGGGLDYVTERKLNQMNFAAEVWNTTNNWQGDYRLMAAEVFGAGFELEKLIEL